MPVEPKIEIMKIKRKYFIGFFLNQSVCEITPFSTTSWT